MIEDNDTTDLAPRLDVAAIFQRRTTMLADLHAFEALDKKLTTDFEELRGYSPLRSERGFGWDGGTLKEQVDQVCWRYLVSLYRLEAYMLCTDYKQMMTDIENHRTPEFTIANAEGWLAGLKSLIHDNVRTLVHKVFAAITEGTYHVGGRNGEEKKRNNNGVDRHFILRSYDHRDVFGYSGTPTVTDDLEKVCYLLAGKPLPEKTAKRIMREGKSDTFTCDFFSLKVCRNGNTHYTLADDVREKLNRYGPEGAVFGENIKIKIVERERWTA